MLRHAQPAEIERKPVRVCPEFFFLQHFLYTLYYATCGADPWYVWIVWRHKAGSREIEIANGLFILPVRCYPWIPYLDFVSLTYWAQSLCEGFQHLCSLLCRNFLYLAYSWTHWLVQKGSICQSRGGWERQCSWPKFRKALEVIAKLLFLHNKCTGYTTCLFLFCS